MCSKSSTERASRARVTHRRSASGLALLSLSLAALTSCGLLPIDTTRPNAAVYLIRADGLERPAIRGAPDAYKPSTQRTTAQGVAYVGFHLTIAAAANQRLELALYDRESGATASFIEIDGPTTDAERAAAGVPEAFSAAAQAALERREGAFWTVDEGTGLSERRVAVLVPLESIRATTKLEMWGSRLADGTPVGLDTIDLVPDFYYVLAIGDSLIWGNGLEERDKMTELVAREIERRLDRRVVVERYAQSGATIVPTRFDGVCEGLCIGEVPFVPTSITTQLGLTQRPDLVDLVIMDGCINDVSLLSLLSPATTLAEIDALSNEYCFGAMRDLLRKLRAMMPEAAVVLIGYYPLVSNQSDSLGLRVWEISRGVIQAEGTAALLPELTEQNERFRDYSNRDLSAAIAAVTAEYPGAGPMGLAQPNFGPENVTFAPDAWLWGLTDENQLIAALNLEFELFPEDPVQSVRLQACFDPGNAFPSLECLYASVGHPNPRGARAYADAILAVLQAQGTLP